MRIGFIGLGRMGSAMSRRLLEQGHDLAVYNRTFAKAQAFADSGARPAGTIADVCEGQDAVATMVADDDALLEVALGDGGVRDSLPSHTVHVVMGTHGVEAVMRLDAAHRERGQRFVAAPVLGRPEVAAEGQLGVVTGGPGDAVEQCRPLFEAIGRRTFHAGETPEAAYAIKLANNFLLGCAIEVMGEAFSLTNAYGVDPNVLYDVMTDGLFSAPAYKVYGRIIADEDYDRVGFTTNLGLKDANLILRAAENVRLPLPTANAWRDRLLGAIAHGGGELDWAVVAREQANAGGLAESQAGSRAG